MGEIPERPEQRENLRGRAERIVEAMANRSEAQIEAQAPDGLGLLLHELFVHKVELEMQNEELRRAQTELEAQKMRYFDLYEMAPVGYCSIDERGLILEANLTAASLMGTPRSMLVAQPFTRFILAEDQDVYYLFRKHLLADGKTQVCELRLVKNDGTTFWGGLSAAVVRNDSGVAVCRLTISDVSRRRQTEEEFRKIHEEKAILPRERPQRG